METPYEVVYYEDRRGKCRTEGFLASLNPQCKASAVVMIARLEEYGPAVEIPQHASPLRGAQNGIWELKGHCHRRAIRLYYWRSGAKEFTIAWGELKEGREPDQSVLNYVTRCYQEWRSSNEYN